MDLKFWIDVATAVGTLSLAAATFYLAKLTRQLEKAWIKTSSNQIETWFKTSSDQIGVNTWLELERRFDSKEMRRARKKLADQFRNYSIAKHDKIAPNGV